MSAAGGGGNRSHRRQAEHRRSMRRHFRDYGVPLLPVRMDEPHLQRQLAEGNNGDEDYEDALMHFRFVVSSWQTPRTERPTHFSNRESFSDWIRWEQLTYQQNYSTTRWNLERNQIHWHRGMPPPAEMMLLKRVRACIGWAIHGLIFEFLDGTRVGFVNDVGSISDDVAIARRQPTEWIDVALGDTVRVVHGFNLVRSCFLCHSIHLEMASGRTISFESSHGPWKGSPFKYDLPQNALLHYVSFKAGQCIGITGFESSMHLPIESPQRVKTLPEPCRQNFLMLQLVSHRIDGGQWPLGRDLWRKIIYEFLACYDLQDQATSTLGLFFKKKAAESRGDVTI